MDVAGSDVALMDGDECGSDIDVRLGNEWAWQSLGTFCFPSGADSYTSIEVPVVAPARSSGERNLTWGAARRPEGRPWGSPTLTAQSDPRGS